MRCFLVFYMYDELYIVKNVRIIKELFDFIVYNWIVYFVFIGCDIKWGRRRILGTNWSKGVI